MATYIIAEIGPNHNGDINLAVEMVEKLSKSGVDAIKFQLSIPENAYSLDAFKPTYQKIGEKSQSPIEMSKKYQLSFEEHRILYKRCMDNNVDYLCSAFEMQSLEFLDKNFDLKYFKIASGEILTIDMLEYIAERNRPILLSTGMATYEEVEQALSILNRRHKKDITILHCISNYPALPESVNLRKMTDLKMRFNYDVGFSDHTIGNEASIAAVALGAQIIEKHVTIDKNMEGPDHQASSTIDEFYQLVKSIRLVEQFFGSTENHPTEKENEVKKAVRKSIVSVRDIQPDEIIKRGDLCFKRPGTGFLPLQIDLIVGKKAAKLIKKNRVIMRNDLQWQ